MNGIIIVNKEKDWTSFDVVAKLRGVLGEKRIGHGGTLDPMATGVLPVFVGKAAKACDMLPNETKSYKAGFLLGTVTDTLDITGKVLETSGLGATKEQVFAAAEKFVGEIMQIPPMYSAVKIGGKKLCNLAREGIVVERKPRPVTVYENKVLSYDESTRRGELYVSCKKGTYVRSIIDDMGKLLGCGAVMTDLERLSSAGFVIENSHRVSEIEKIVSEGKLDSILLNVENAFNTVYTDEIRLGERASVLYKNGVKLFPNQFGVRSPESLLQKKLMVYGADGEFLGLGYIENEGFKLRSLKNFY